MLFPQVKISEMVKTRSVITFRSIRVKKLNHLNPKSPSMVQATFDSILTHHSSEFSLFCSTIFFCIQQHLNITQFLIGLTAWFSQSEIEFRSNFLNLGEKRQRMFLRMVGEYGPCCFSDITSEFDLHCQIG